MKVLHVNFDGSNGGAAIAAKRISAGLRLKGIDSKVWVARNTGSSDGVLCIKGNIFQKLDGIKNIFIQKIAKIMSLGDVRSYNLIPSRLVHQLNASDADVIHLHWVNAEMISIAQLAKIKKPVVWTLHDMWAFCGAEHITTDSRYVSGYPHSAGEPFDVDRWTFLRKQKHWENWYPTIVTPSNWLKKCAEESLLFRNRKVSVIPNCLDLSIFKPSETAKCRKTYRLPTNKKVILFGAANPDDNNKGVDLLERALANLSNKSQYAVAIFGKNGEDQLDGIETFWLGPIKSEQVMAGIYNCADVMCVPSRIDNLPNTAVEATACGIPVVAFNVGGLSDIVEHKINGYLAKPFDPEDLANGIEWVVSNPHISDSKKSNYEKISRCARHKAEISYHSMSVAESYYKTYEESIEFNTRQKES